ncbi:MAG TPA: hypothetical protein VMY05_11445 [Acidobacteriota bacterium]|nr:hypothetical protein [Acidobacteriota bacterium]
MSGSVDSGQPRDNPRATAFQQLIEERAKSIRGKFLVDESKVQRVLENLVYSTNIKLLPAESGLQIIDTQASRLSNAIGSAILDDDRRRIIDTLWEGDTVKQLGRVLALDTLSDYACPLYSLNELQHIIEAFYDHQLANRIHLIRTGHPQTSFERSAWLEDFLNVLLPTKHTFIVRNERTETGDLWHTYFWPARIIEARMVTPPAGVRAVRYGPGFVIGADFRVYGRDDVELKSVEYEDSPVPRFYRRLQKYCRLTSLEERARLMDARIEIIRTLVEGLSFRDPERLRSDFTRALHSTLSSQDIDRLLRIEYAHYCCRNRIQKPDYDNWELRCFPANSIGGLQDLMSLAGCFERELRLGCYHKARQSLGDLGLVHDDLLQHPRLRFDSDVDIATRANTQRIKAALDAFHASWEPELDFWNLYEYWAQQMLRDDFDIEVVISKKVKSSQVIRFKSAVESFVDIAKRQIDSAGYIPDPQMTLGGHTGSLAASADSTESVDESVFRHSPDYRAVWLRGSEYMLTPREAQVIQILHEQYEQGVPWIGKDWIIQEVSGSESNIQRLRDLFRDKKVYYALVKKSEGQAIYRLNI